MGEWSRSGVSGDGSRWSGEAGLPPVESLLPPELLHLVVKGGIVVCLFIYMVH